MALIHSFYSGSGEHMRVRIKLKEIAQAKEISQRQLSLKSGVDIKTVQRIMRDPYTVVTTETLGKLAQFLKIDASELIENAPSEEAH
jgi:transcriptional regulator with XRE-family HTH domain